MKISYILFPLFLSCFLVKAQTNLPAFNIVNSTNVVINIYINNASETNTNTNKVQTLTPEQYSILVRNQIFEEKKYQMLEQRRNAAFDYQLRRYNRPAPIF